MNDNKLKIDFNFLMDIDLKAIFNQYKNKIKNIHDIIKNKNLPSQEMTRWMTYPFEIEEKEIIRMENIKSKWEKLNIDTILVIGIGGSYTGTKAGIDMSVDTLNSKMKIYYANNISSDYINSLINCLKDKNFGIVVCSKSGNTLEPQINLRIFYDLLKSKYSNQCSERVIAVTDPEHGTLHELAIENNWEIFSLDSGIGGRFSAISPIGLVPFVLMGMNIRELINGCRDALNNALNNEEIELNNAIQYAIFRHFFHVEMKKSVEIINVYEEKLFYFTEHIKQLFAESEGKDKKGLLPYNCKMTTDLHSVGQLIQEGNKCFFETSILVDKINNDLKLCDPFSGNDKLEYLDGTKISEINNIAAISTIKAHAIDGNVPNIVIHIQNMNEYMFGYLYSWYSCVELYSGMLLEVNPFNQPGVENYKKRMFSELKKLK